MEDFYKKALMKYGEDNIKSLGWGSTIGQQKRFKVFLQEMNPYNKSFLDVGCGFGDFYRYIDRRCKRYIGIDIEPEMIDIARRKNPNGAFLTTDIIDFPADKESFDYVVASGLLALKREDWDENLSKTIRRMFDICRIAVGVNFTRCTDITKINPDAHYSSQALVIGLLDSIKYKSLKIIVDYLPNDFTVILYK